MKPIINITIVFTFTIFSVLLIDSLFETDIYNQYLYFKPVHNSLMLVLLGLFVSLPIYSIYNFISKRDFKNSFNYLAILGSLFYLYQILVELNDKTI